jgi:rhodanese-related sulfurtransferase
VSTFRARTARRVYNGRMSKKDNRTTFLTAVGTFLGLSLITVVAWSLTRTVQPAPALVSQAAAVAAPAAEETFERIAFDDFKKLVDAGQVTVIDVRSMEQFVASHIPGALHIPVARIEGEIPYLPKGKPIVTYCTCPAEESSGEAAMILMRAGVPAKALQGGMEEWTRRGFPMATGVK